MPSGAASWTFTDDDAQAITAALQRFLRESHARCALLVDRAGQLVTTVGEAPSGSAFDVTAFASLTAADFSANDQLARLIGERDFSTLFHQGEKESMFLADVALTSVGLPTPVPPDRSGDLLDVLLEEGLEPEEVLAVLPHLPVQADTADAVAAEVDLRLRGRP